MAGTLIIQSIPQGASIELDNADTFKNTPNTFILSAGTHHWVVNLSSYIRMEGDVIINDGEIHELIIPLQSEYYKEIITLAKIGLAVSAIAILASLVMRK